MAAERKEQIPLGRLKQHSPLQLLQVVQTLQAQLSMSASSSGGTIVENLQAGLKTRLEGAVRGFAGELRRELPVWLAAIDSLERLAASPLLGGSESASALQQELRAAEAQATLILDLVESLPFAPDAAALEPTTYAEPGAAVLPFAARTASAELRRPSSAKGDSKTASELAAPPSPSVLAPNQAVIRDLCAQAHQHWLDENYALAIDCYTRLIQCPPPFAAAYLKRGQLHHLCGEYERAVEDYTSALQLDPGQPKARFHRGDALARLGLWDEAVADYDRVLELAPDFIAARHNRAAVFHLRGNPKQAIAEFTAILDAAPHMDSVFYNRGLAYLAIEDFPNAIKDFTKAIDANPEDTRSRAKLDKARERWSANTKPHVAMPTHVSPTEIEPPDPPSEMNPVAKEKKQPDERNQIKFTCPACDAVWSVPWDRLGHVIKCKKCSRHYAVKSDGQLTAVKPKGDGSWIETAPPTPFRKRLIQQHWKKLALTGVAAFLLCVGLGAWATARSSASPRALAALPHELEPRAALLGKAWLTNDLPLMRRLTLSTYERGIYAWALRNPPPLLRKVDSSDLEDLKIDVQSSGKVGNTVNVLVRFHGLSASSQPTIEFRQCWEERDGGWFFIPPRNKG